MHLHEKDGVRLLGLTCRRCGGAFGVCRSCYHGQRYCSERCRKDARREQCCQAQKRYMAKRTQRLAAAKAAVAYRERIKSGKQVVLKQNVIDQRLDGDGKTGHKEHAVTHCVRCGRRGQVARWVT